MSAAQVLKRAAMIGVTVMALVVGSSFVQPIPLALAATLPDSDTGSPAIGYPGGGCPAGCPVMAVLPHAAASAPDTGYPSIGPWRSCGSGSCAQATLPDSHVGSPDIGYPCAGGCQDWFHPSSPSSAGGVGYPSGGCGGPCGTLEVVSPAPSGDTGYPVCPGCDIFAQPSSPVVGDTALI